MAFEKRHEKTGLFGEREHTPQHGIPHDGHDELNLAELPLSGVADRYLDGRNIAVYSYQVRDADRRGHVSRDLVISGSDSYGLPTAKDEDVLLACIQLSRAGDCQGGPTRFTRYQLLKLLHWPNEGKYYQRLSTTLQRWRGVTIYTNRASYDGASKTWINAKFGVFDDLHVQERKSRTGKLMPSSSWFVWSEAMLSQIQSRQMRRLDLELYFRLLAPVAKRLYRILAQRFHEVDEVKFDLHELAFQRIRMTGAYNIAQIKRALANGIHELETHWELRRLAPQKRFIKKRRGEWEIVFARRRPVQILRADEKAAISRADLIVELTRRGIGPAMADELVSCHPVGSVELMLELFDWYRGRGQAKGPTFLVHSIRGAPGFRFPPGFRSRRRGQANGRSPIESPLRPTTSLSEQGGSLETGSETGFSAVGSMEHAANLAEPGDNIKSPVAASPVREMKQEMT